MQSAKTRKIEKGIVSFDLKNETFCVEGGAHRFVPLLAAILLIRKFRIPILLGLFSLTGFKYGPDLTQILELLRHLS